jgi:hypothetical protein
MTCQSARQKLAAYSEDSLSPREASALRRHLIGCEACHQEYEYGERLASPLRELDSVMPPPLFATSIRLRLFSQIRMTLWERWQVRLSNLMRPVALPAAGGLLSALILFGAFLPLLSVSRSSALIKDVPTMLITGPRFMQASPFEIDEDLLIEAWIDERGKVASFEVLNPAQSTPAWEETIRIRSGNVLLTTLFEPATRFGQPIAGKIVFSLHRINIRP